MITADYLSGNANPVAREVWHFTLRGLVRDDKPVTGVTNGSEFIEIDSGKRYLFDADSHQWLDESGTPAPAVVVYPVKLEMIGTETETGMLDYTIEADTTIEQMNAALNAGKELLVFATISVEDAPEFTTHTVLTLDSSDMYMYEVGSSGLSFKMEPAQAWWDFNDIYGPTAKMIEKFHVDGNDNWSVSISSEPCEAPWPKYIQAPGHDDPVELTESMALYAMTTKLPTMIIMPVADGFTLAYPYGDAIVDFTNQLASGVADPTINVAMCVDSPYGIMPAQVIPCQNCGYEIVDGILTLNAGIQTMEDNELAFAFLKFYFPLDPESDTVVELFTKPLSSSSGSDKIVIEIAPPEPGEWDGNTGMEYVQPVVITTPGVTIDDILGYIDSGKDIELRMTYEMVIPDITDAAVFRFSFDYSKMLINASIGLGMDMYSAFFISPFIESKVADQDSLIILQQIFGLPSDANTLTITANNAISPDGEIGLWWDAMTAALGEQAVTITYPNASQWNSDGTQNAVVKLNGTTITPSNYFNRILIPSMYDGVKFKYVLTFDYDGVRSIHIPLDIAKYMYGPLLSGDEYPFDMCTKKIPEYAELSQLVDDISDPGAHDIYLEIAKWDDYDGPMGVFKWHGIVD